MKIAPDETRMLRQIKKEIDKELRGFIGELNRSYALRRLSPLLFEGIRDFLLRDGKRIRPILFVIGYRGFARTDARHLYTSAIAIELLHDFMLVHDDIIDKSDTRRGKPSMHMMLDKHLRGNGHAKFNGQDLAIVIGDVMYAMAIRAFLACDAPWDRKEEALKRFIDAAIFTGSGEFIELIYGAEDLRDASLERIYRVYDYKTAYYTFACPLATGAILAGAPKAEVARLNEYGMCLGRAFQIKDDILGMFSEESEIGKSSLTDVKEAKKTILVWFAWRNGSGKDRSLMRKIFSKANVSRNDLLQMRQIVTRTGSLDNAHRQVQRLLKRSHAALEASRLKDRYKSFLLAYASNLLTRNHGPSTQINLHVPFLTSRANSL